MSYRYACTLLIGLAVVAACRDYPTEQTLAGASAFSVGGAATCPTPATTVVTSEPELLAALAAAGPGDVIGIDGIIKVTAGVVVADSSITLTCATPGSGLAVDTFASAGILLQVTARSVTVDRLVLNGTRAGDAFGTLAGNTRFTNNVVTCGTSTCAFFIGAPWSMIADNAFTSHGSGSGVHIQPLGAIVSDGIRVEGNRIVATAPSGNPTFGGIRVVGGASVVIANNTVLGPWQNSISPTSVVSIGAPITPLVAGNSLHGAVRFGIRLGGGGSGTIRVRSGMFRNNIVSAAGIAGVLVIGACNNLFVGNNLQGNADGVGIQFATPSGGNTFVGNDNVSIDGAAPFDCNGDGVPDPNVVNGLGAVLNGVNLGAAVGDGVVVSNGLLQ